MRLRHWLPAICAVAMIAIGLAWLLWLRSESPAPKPVEATTPQLASSGDKRLNAAEKAAFPNGRTGASEGGAVIQYEQGKLIDAPFGPVLVSEGQVLDAAHVDSGYVAIHYLAPAGAGFRVVKAFPRAVQSGSFGRLEKIEVSRDFSAFPMVLTRGGGTWQGYTCSWTTITELTPQGPVELVQFMDSYDDRGATADGSGSASEGQISKIVHGQSFTVHFKGKRNFDAVYVRGGDHYELQGGEKDALEGC